MLEWKEIIFGLVGGLGIFLYGMNLMSEGLKRLAGDRMKNILAMLTKNRLFGVTVGALITAVIQSSSATTVMTVGFVNAGILTLTQAVSVVMGANIGTTITAQIIAFKITHYAPLMIGAGTFLHLLIKNKRWRLYGQALLGLGLLFFGLYLMSGGVKPLRSHESVRQFFQTFSTNPLTALLAGVVMTCVLQSSSATIGLAMVLAQQGLIDFNGAIPLILGNNIGTTITAQLAALNTSRMARRTAISHTIFNVLGAAIFLPLVMMGIYQKFIIFVTPGQPDNLKHIGRFIANAHTAFNLINTIIFIFLINLLVRASKWIIPVKPDERKAAPTLLEPHLLNTPPMALQLVRKEMVHMLRVSKRALEAGIKSIMDGNPKFAENAHKLEDATDDFQHAITEYLIALSERDLSSYESDQLPTMIHSVNDIERVGDLAEDLAQISENMQLHKMKFSHQARESLREMNTLVLNMFPPLIKAVEQEDPPSALEVLELEKKVNRLRRQLDNDHIERLKAGICDLPAGNYYIDAIHNLENIGDYLKNVAQTAYNLFTWSKGKPKLKEIRKKQGEQNDAAEVRQPE